MVLDHLFVYSCRDKFGRSRDQAIDHLNKTLSLGVLEHLLGEVDDMAGYVDILVASSRWDSFLKMARQHSPRPGTLALPQPVDRSGISVHPLGSVPRNSLQPFEIDQESSSEERNAIFDNINSVEERIFNAGLAVLEFLPCNAHGTESHDSSEHGSEITLNSRPYEYQHSENTGPSIYTASSEDTDSLDELCAAFQELTFLDN